MSYEKMKVEVTESLLEYCKEFGNRYELVDIHGKEYIKVYGDEYRDLCRFKYGWLMAGRGNLMLDYCNISSEGYWCVSQIVNFYDLDMNVMKKVFAMNG